MKLIDILVEELPKHGGWPKRANCITQDPDKRVEPATCLPPVAKCDDDGFWFLDSSRIGGFEVDTLASDHTTAIITREQYEAALAAKNDGWIEWGGGECPVSDSTIVEVRYRNGEVKASAPADFYEWGHGRPHFVTTGRDIIAYRLHKLQEAEQAKADDEADLNEFIGQDAAPVWSGEGQPPVGCECEFMKHTLDAMPNWRRGIIKYVSEYTVVIVEALSPGEFVAHPRTCDFRPTRSEAERKRDAAVEAIDRYMPEFIPDTPNDYYNAKKIYDAIAAGKIPGLRLED
jgi:hypothetical protein